MDANCFNNLPFFCLENYPFRHHSAAAEKAPLALICFDLMWVDFNGDVATEGERTVNVDALLWSDD